MEINVDPRSVLRSASRRTILIVAVGATYYLALNAVLIRAIIEQVRLAPRSAMATQAHFQAESPDRMLRSDAPASISHALREHSREQVSQAIAAQGAIGIGAARLGLPDGASDLAGTAYEATPPFQQAQRR